jgi:LysR family transcriptional regulator, hydrogen peroxide-inducible genes activator
MISFQQIQYILAIEETRHFQKASDLCFVTQPTLSMQVKKAEEVLGYPVFDRSSSPLSLTPFGENLIPLLRELQIDFDNIQKLVLKSSGTYKERLRLAIIPTISPFMVPDMFDKWKSLLPNVQLVMEEMKSEEILLALDRNEVDLAILAGPINSEKLRVNPLFKEEIKAYIPSIKNTEISTESLQKLHPWLLSKGNCLRTQMIHFCELGASKNDQWNYEGGNLELLLRIVDLKGGYTLVPEEYQRILKLDTSSCKKITSDLNNEIPAREIIAISSKRSSKWGSIEAIIRSVQLFYGKNRDESNFKVLDWK